MWLERKIESVFEHDIQEGTEADKDKYIPDPDMQGLIERFVSHMCNNCTPGVLRRGA